MKERTKIGFLAYQLQVGGAERQLCLLASRLDRSRFEPFVVTAYAGGGLEKELRDAGVRVISADKRSQKDILGFWRRLRAIARQENPDIIYSMSDYANVLNQLLRTSGCHHRTIWGLRASDNQPRAKGIIWYGVFLAARFLSRWANHTISNSEAGLRYYRGAGFTIRSANVIPNGIDTDRFRPDQHARQRIRREWDVGDSFVVGFLARIQPKKDLPTFLDAARRLLTRDGLTFVIVGSDQSAYAQELRRVAKEMGPKVHWVGERLDVADVMCAFDMYCLTSSFGEGHPNTLGEAMAMELVVAASDCGDARAMLEDERWLFSPGDSGTLSLLIERASQLPPDERRAIGERNRSRANREFSVRRLLERTAYTLDELA